MKSNAARTSDVPDRRATLEACIHTLLSKFSITPWQLYNACNGKKGRFRDIASWLFENNEAHFVRRLGRTPRARKIDLTALNIAKYVEAIEKVVEPKNHSNPGLLIPNDEEMRDFLRDYDRPGLCVVDEDEEKDFSWFEYVELYKSEDSEGDAPRTVPPILIFTLHDGNCIPKRFLPRDAAAREALLRSFEKERDWGADLIAYALASALDLPGFYRVRMARCALDFGRLPVVTGKDQDASFLGRGAVNSPLVDHLKRSEISDLLNYYDKISDALEVALAATVTGKCLSSEIRHADWVDNGYADLLGESQPMTMLGIHTYDPGTHRDNPRPGVSLIDRSDSLQKTGHLTPGVFDPLYPSHMAQVTADRALTRRLGLELERRYILAVDNYPYLLPDGSVEMRVQAFLFFKYLELQYQSQSNEGAVSPELWAAIQNANSRRLDTIGTMAALHRFANLDHAGKKESVGVDEMREHYEKIRDQYQALASWMKREDGQMATLAYRVHYARPNSLAIETCKPLALVQDARTKRFVPKFNLHKDKVVEVSQRANGKWAPTDKKTDRRVVPLLKLSPKALASEPIIAFDGDAIRQEVAAIASGMRRYYSEDVPGKRAFHDANREVIVKRARLGARPQRPEGEPTRFEDDSV